MSRPSGSARSSERSSARSARSGIGERIAGDRFQEKGLDRPDPGTHRQGSLVEQRRQHIRSPFGVVAGEPQRRAGDPHLRERALCIAHLGEDLLGALELTQPHQRSDQVAGDPRREHMGLDEELAQALGRAKGLQGLHIITVRRFEQPAHHVEHQPASG